MIAALLLAALFVLAVLGHVSWWVAAPVLVVVIGVRVLLQILGVALIAAAREAQKAQRWSVR